MSNERIDLTKFDEKFSDLYTLCLHVEDFVTDDEELGALVVRLTDLIAELKRCYDLIDKYEVLSGGLKHLLKESWWVATCKPDGEGRCSLEINSYEELMKLVDSNKVEIPEYSHDDDELLLYDEYCTCGISHEEWLESKN